MAEVVEQAREAGIEADRPYIAPRLHLTHISLQRVDGLLQARLGDEQLTFANEARGVAQEFTDAIAKGDDLKAAYYAHELLQRREISAEEVKVAMILTYSAAANRLEEQRNALASEAGKNYNEFSPLSQAIETMEERKRQWESVGTPDSLKVPEAGEEFNPLLCIRQTLYTFMRDSARVSHGSSLSMTNEVDKALGGLIAPEATPAKVGLDAYRHMSIDKQVTDTIEHIWDNTFEDSREAMLHALADEARPEKKAEIIDTLFDRAKDVQEDGIFISHDVEVTDEVQNYFATHAKEAWIYQAEDKSLRLVKLEDGLTEINLTKLYEVNPQLVTDTVRDLFVWTEMREVYRRVKEDISIHEGPNDEVISENFKKLVDPFIEAGLGTMEVWDLVGMLISIPGAPDQGSQAYRTLRALLSQINGYRAKHIVDCEGTPPDVREAVGRYASIYAVLTRIQMSGQSNFGSIDANRAMENPYLLIPAHYEAARRREEEAKAKDTAFAHFAQDVAQAVDARMGLRAELSYLTENILSRLLLLREKRSSIEVQLRMEFRRNYSEDRPEPLQRDLEVAERNLAWVEEKIRQKQSEVRDLRAKLLARQEGQIEDLLRANDPSTFARLEAFKQQRLNDSPERDIFAEIILNIRVAIRSSEARTPKAIEDMVETALAQMPSLKRLPTYNEYFYDNDSSHDREKFVRFKDVYLRDAIIMIALYEASRTEIGRSEEADVLLGGFAIARREDYKRTERIVNQEQAQSERAFSAFSELLAQRHIPATIIDKLLKITELSDEKKAALGRDNAINTYNIFCNLLVLSVDPETGDVLFDYKSPAIKHLLQTLYPYIDEEMIDAFQATDFFATESEPLLVAEPERVS